MEAVRRQFGETNRLTLSSIFKESRDLNELITIFLATLELVKVHEISMEQKETFGDIYLVRREDESLS